MKLPLVFVLASTFAFGCTRAELSPNDRYERDLSTAAQAVSALETLPVELRGPALYTLLEREDERSERILREAGAPETWRPGDPFYSARVAALFERCELFQECADGMGERLGVKGFQAFDSQSASGGTL